MTADRSEVTTAGITEAGFQLPQEHLTPKDKLSGEQLGDLLSAFGNHEAKAAILLLMEPGNVYTYRSLHSAFIHAQGRNLGWLMNSAGPLTYCRSSLAPIGLVAREVVNADLSIYGYMITEYGESVGKPLAGLLLDFSRRHPEISLSDLFGGTASKYTTDIDKSNEGDSERKKRSPLIRHKIFFELSTAYNFPVRTVELANSIGEYSTTVGNHLLKIGASGIIDYESVDPHNPFSVYSFTETQPALSPSPYGSKNKLTQWVYQTLSNNPTKKFRIKELEFLYQDQHSGKIGQGILITNVLAHLRRNGYVNIEKFANRELSEINLSHEQREIIVELVQILDSFQNQEPANIQQGLNSANFFRTHPEEIAHLMVKAKDHSRAANKRPREETAEYILSIIGENEGITISDVTKILSERFHIPFRRSDVWALAKNLVESGQLVFIMKNGRNRYSLSQANISTATP